jgi:hypothetical protein
MTNELKFLKPSMWNYARFIPPSRLPEAVIQAEVYKRLLDKDIQCTVGCPIFCAVYNGELSPDIAILYKGYVIGIIEIKSFKKVKSVSNQIINNLDVDQIKSKQLKRYLLYELPLYYCTTWDDIPRAVKFAELCVDEFKKNTQHRDNDRDEVVDRAITAPE